MKSILEMLEHVGEDRASKSATKLVARARGVVLPEVFPVLQDAQVLLAEERAPDGRAVRVPSRLESAHVVH